MGSRNYAELLTEELVARGLDRHSAADLATRFGNEYLLNGWFAFQAANIMVALAITFDH